MAPRSDIAELISQLSRTEKRYIRMQVSLHGQDKVYIKLLDAIDADPDIPDDALGKLIGRQGTGKGESLSVYKNYLYHVILRSLRNYHQKSTENQEFLTVLANLEVLFHKGLYRQCRKMIRREKKRCYETEKYYYVLEIIRMEKRLIMVNSYSDVTYKDFNDLYKEEQRVIEIIRRLSAWWRVANIVNKNLLSHENKRAYPVSYYQKILRSKYMHFPEKMLVRSERYYRSVILSGCYYALGDSVNHYLTTRDNVAFVEENPQLKREEINKYLSLNHYLMKAQLEMGLPDDVLANLEKLERMCAEPVYANSENVLSRVFYLRVFFGLRACLKKGDYAAAEVLSLDFVRNYKKFATRFDPAYIVEIKYFQALLAFHQTNSRRALQILQQILNDPYYDIDKDVFRFARILQAVVHYHLGNDEVLEYLLKAMHNHYRSAKKYHQVELLVLRVLGSTLHKRSKKEKMDSLREEIASLRNDVFEKDAFEFFDALAWLDKPPVFQS